MHHSTFEYLKPTDEQIYQMGKARSACANCAKELEICIPDGPDKTYLLRKLREVSMWANVAITRQPDGSPRVLGDICVKNDDGTMSFPNRENQS